MSSVPALNQWNLPVGLEPYNPEGPPCPNCGKPLEHVRYPSGCYLNREQWESVRAGDFMCQHCPDNGRAANKKFAYFWASEVNQSQPTLAQASAMGPWSTSGIQTVAN